MSFPARAVSPVPSVSFSACGLDDSSLRRVADFLATPAAWGGENPPSLEGRVTPAVGNPRKRRSDGSPPEAQRKLVIDHPVAAEWHPRNQYGPNFYTQGSAQKVWWQCSADKTHEWQTAIFNRCKSKKPTGCPKCPKALTQDLVSEHPLAQEWHPDNPKEAHEYSQGSNVEVLWKCALGHEWKARIASRFRKVGSAGCRECTRMKGRGKKTVAEHPVAKEWHPDNPKGPHEYTQGSNVKVLWQCAKEHIWKAKIQVRCKAKSPTKCPECHRAKGRRSVADHAIAGQWHPTRNEKGAEHYSQGSDKRVWWQCAVGHAWEAAINNCCREKRSNNCPQCRIKKSR